MLSATTNGCSCHMIQSPGQPHKTCISCGRREYEKATGNCCSKCKIGIWGARGDYDHMGGLCTLCYYNG